MSGAIDIMVAKQSNGYGANYHISGNLKKVEMNQFGQYYLEPGFNYSIFVKSNGGMRTIDYNLMAVTNNQCVALEQLMRIQLTSSGWQKVSPQPIRQRVNYNDQIVTLHDVGNRLLWRVVFTNQNLHQIPGRRVLSRPEYANRHAPRLLSIRDHATRRRNVPIRLPNGDDMTRKIDDARQKMNDSTRRAQYEAEMKQIKRKARLQNQQDYYRAIHNRRLSADEEKQLENEEHEYDEQLKNLIVAPFEIPLSTPNKYFLSLEE